MRIKSGVAWHEVDNEVIVLDTNTSLYVSINAAGAALWTSLAAGVPAGELPGVLVTRFGISRAAAEADAAAFLTGLVDQGLLEAS